MNKSTIPTILGLLILVIATGSVLFIIKGVQTFQSGASANLQPIDVRVTNVKDTSFTVSWVTSTDTIGIVRYSSGSGSWQSLPTSFSKVHFTTIQNLAPGNVYSISINSGGQIFSGDSIPSQVTTLGSYIPHERIISGQILDANNVPMKDVLVYVAVNGVITNSSLTTASGSWVISLPDMADSTILQIIAEATTNDQASAQIDLKSANPVPAISIGSSYDFRNQQSSQNNDIPQVPIKF